MYDIAVDTIKKEQNRESLTSVNIQVLQSCIKYMVWDQDTKGERLSLPAEDIWLSKANMRRGRGRSKPFTCKSSKLIQCYHS